MRVNERYNREADQPRSKDQLFSKWRNTNAVAVQFHTVFLRTRHEAVNGETEEILLVNTLEAFREETNKLFRFVEF